MEGRNGGSRGGREGAMGMVAVSVAVSVVVVGDAKPRTVMVEKCVVVSVSVSFTVVVAVCAVPSWTAWVDVTGTVEPGAVSVSVRVWTETVSVASTVDTHTG